MFEYEEKNGSRYIVIKTDDLSARLNSLSLEKPIEVPFGSDADVLSHIVEYWYYEKLKKGQSNPFVQHLKKIILWLKPKWENLPDDEIIYISRGYDSDSDTEEQSGVKNSKLEPNEKSFLEDMVNLVNEGERFTNVLTKLCEKSYLEKADWENLLTDKKSKQKHGLGMEHGRYHIYYPGINYNPSTDKKRNHNREIIRNQHLEHLTLKERKIAEKELKAIQNADIVRVDEITGELKALIGDQVKIITTDFVIASHRGVHYLLDRWSNPARESHYNYNERDLLYPSENALKSLDDLKRDIQDNPVYYMHFHQMRDALETKNSNVRKNLDENARVLQSNIVQYLRASFYVAIKKGREYDFFNNELFMINYVYSNGIANYLRLLSVMLQNYPDHFKNLFKNPFNFLVSVSELPYHSIRYCLGELKKPYDQCALFPNYIGEGRIFIPHVGKVVLGLHPIQDLIDEKSPDNIRILHRQCEISVRQNVIDETEISFLGFIPEERIFEQCGVKHASFHQSSYKEVYLRKFGFTLKMYSLFRETYQLARQGKVTLKGNKKDQYGFIDLLEEWICQFHAARLHVITLHKIADRSKTTPTVLIYYHPEQRFTIEELPRRVKKGQNALNGLTASDRQKYARWIFNECTLSENDNKPKVAAEYLFVKGKVYDSEELKIRLISQEDFERLLVMKGEDKNVQIHKAESPGTPLSKIRTPHTSPESARSASPYHSPVLTSPYKFLSKPVSETQLDLDDGLTNNLLTDDEELLLGNEGDGYESPSP